VHTGDQRLTQGGPSSRRSTPSCRSSWLVLKLAADVAGGSDQAVPDTLDRLYTDLLDLVRARHGDQTDVLLGLLAAAGPGPALPFDVLAEAVTRLGRPLSRAERHTVLGDPDLYSVLDRTRPGHADEHLGLFHETLVDHLLAETGSREAHRAIADTLEELASASQHEPKSYPADPLLSYAFDAGPRHRWQAGQPELLVAELERREDPLPRVNLTRWTAWAGSIRDCLGRDHPGT
jgi:hypothetical protein